jgi:hypothetical protein
MPSRPSFVVIAAALIVMACTPLRMGESQSALSQLLERQRACDAKKAENKLTNPKDVAECIDTSGGLVALAREMAQEAGKPGTNAPNAVFFYRRAATAAWRSEEPKAMQEAITYAKAGSDLCGGDRSRSEIAPGDCALLSLIPAAVTHDEAMIAFRALENEVAGKGTPETLREYTAPTATPLAGVGAELNTRIGAPAQRAFEGWSLLGDALPAICRSDVDPSVRNYANIVRQDMINNLKLIYDRIELRTGRGYASGDYDAACVVTRQGDKISSVGISSLADRDDLPDRVTRAAWCRWQTAQRNAAEICR